MNESKGSKQLERLFSGSTGKQRFAIRKIIKSLFYNSHHSNLELSKITDFSIPTVSTLLDNLIDHKVVEVRGQGNSNGGRKPLQYGLNQEFGYIIAVYIDQYYTRMAILNLQCEHIADSKVISLRLSNDPHVTAALCKSIADFIHESGITRSSILGIGVGMPGLIDVKKGVNNTFFKASFEKHGCIISTKFV